jgi:hypothetical protein
MAATARQDAVNALNDADFIHQLKNVAGLAHCKMNNMVDTAVDAVIDTANVTLDLLPIKYDTPP